MFEKYPFYLNS